jgi:hypothetical protein
MKDKEIDNHRQLLAILTEEKNYETLRKGEFGLSKTQVKKAEKEDRTLTPYLEKMKELYEGLPDWSRTEKIINYVDLTSGVSNDLVFPPHFIDRVNEKKIDSIFSVPQGETGVGWFCVTEVHEKKTKNNKRFYRLRIIDDQNNFAWLRVWGTLPEIPDPYSLWMAAANNDPNWGMSTSAYKIKKINAFE